MPHDVSLRCTLFRAPMALSYCATKCPHAARGALRCPDLVKVSTEQPDEMKKTLVAVHAQGHVITDAFKGAFPTFIPAGVPPSVSRLITKPVLAVLPPATALAATAPAAAPAATTMQSSVSKTSKVPEPSPAPKTATSALEPKPAAPAVTAPASPAAKSSKPATAGGKEKTMAEPDSTTTQSPAATDGAPAKAKGKGGLPKGYKFNKPRGTVKAAAAAGGTKSRNIGMLFFVETEPKSGLFKIEPLKEFGDVMVILDGSNRRVIGAVSAREF